MAEHEVTREDIYEALDYAIAIAEEHAGGPHKIKSQLEALGLDPEGVRDFLYDRWEVYKGLFDPDQPHLLFVQGATEALMVGAVLRRRKP